MSQSQDNEFDFLQRFPASELVLGPIQRSEAIAIYGILRSLRPKRVVEIGFGQGDSTEALLAATRGIEGATVTSYDIHVRQPYVDDLKKRYGNLEVFQADQSTLKLPEGPEIDVLFLDASHDLELNKRFWAANEHLLTERTLVLVHDTGLWADGTFDDSKLSHFGRRGENRGIKGRFHQPGEVEFVRWLTSVESAERPKWTRIDIGSAACFRHGFSILQRTSDSLL
jgi:predicted O-methyltransferase YrrM